MESLMVHVNKYQIQKEREREKERKKETSTHTPKKGRNIRVQQYKEIKGHKVRHWRRTLLSKILR